MYSVIGAVSGSAAGLHVQFDRGENGDETIRAEDARELIYCGQACVLAAHGVR